MADDPVHQHVEFARRYSSQFEPTLNAYCAMSRLSALAGDIHTLRAIPDIPSGMHRPEVISYYAVGFVTCLEWHARSRIVDLFTFRPQCITGKDFKEIGSDKLGQITSANITVAHLLGAMTKVGTFENYIQKFERLYKELDFPSSPSQVLAAYDDGQSIFLGEKPDLRKVLSDLFEFRNSLVHEIDWRVLGPPTLEDKLDLNRALEFAYAASAAMRTLESEITRYGPRRFPNRLDEVGDPLREDEILGEEIKRLEEEIRLKLQPLEGGDRWDQAVNSSRLNMLAELEFVFHSSFLRPNRYVDERSNTRVRLCRGRLNYLEGLVAELADMPEGELF